jgi:Mg/Co/Ni transporter MgtE
MTSIEKSINSNLASASENINFGEDNLNELFKSLDEETKKKILKYSKKDIQISILKNMLDPELSELWNNMSDKQKKQLDSFGIRDRFIFLKDILFFLLVNKLII